MQEYRSILAGPVLVICPVPLQERSSVRCVEGIQWLLQPPLFWDGHCIWAQAQAQGRALLKPLHMLTQAPKKGGCGTQKGRSQARPYGSPCLTLSLLLPGAEDPQRETRSTRPSHGAGQMAMLSSVLHKSSGCLFSPLTKDLYHIPSRAGL